MIDFYGSRTKPPLSQGRLDHAHNNFKFAVACIFFSEMGNVAVGLNAEDWAINIIDLRVTNINLQEKTWMQGTGRLQSPH